MKDGRVQDGLANWVSYGNSVEPAMPLHIQIMSTDSWTQDLKLRIRSRLGLGIGPPLPHSPWELSVGMWEGKSCAQMRSPRRWEEALGQDPVNIYLLRVGRLSEGTWKWREEMGESCYHRNANSEAHSKSCSWRSQVSTGNDTWEVRDIRSTLWWQRRIR